MQIITDTDKVKMLERLLLRHQLHVLTVSPGGYGGMVITARSDHHGLAGDVQFTTQDPAVALRAQEYAAHPIPSLRPAQVVTVYGEG